MGKTKSSVNGYSGRLVIHSAPSVTSIDQKLRDTSSCYVIGENRHPVMNHKTYHSDSVNGSEIGRRTPLKRRAVTPNPSRMKDGLGPKNLKSGTQRYH